SCEVQQFRENFANWTSGNKEIDHFIQSSQIHQKAYLNGFHLANFQHINLTMEEQSLICMMSTGLQAQESCGIRSCKNISGIDWYGMSRDPETNALISVSEYADNGSLLDYLRLNCINLSWKTRLNFLWQISRDFQCLFNSGFTYSALGTGSFVVKSDQTVALRDFLCAIDSEQSHVYKYCALKYVGPEFFEKRKITKECNIYTFGLIMYRFSAPFMQELEKGLDLSLVPESTPKCYTNLMRQCLNHDPNFRPSITQIINKLGELYLEMGRNIRSQITAEFRIADEFRQTSCVESDKKLNELGAVSSNDKDISTGSLLSTISNLGVDLIDFDQFTNKQYIGE
ncbi:21249_t:CDS:2, partial [Dentiscutata erythropus]